MLNNEEQIKNEVLIENTAQAIFNYLKEIENKKEVYEKRWIWELLQNALDVCPQSGRIDIEIKKEGEILTFSHNGRPFSAKEIAHLIFHGSTKRRRENILDQQEEYIGKFGTGFLTTHLLSKRVNIRGIREDNKKFEFELNREGGSPFDIQQNMERSWQQYINSLKPYEEEISYTAEYTYYINNSVNIVTSGLETLIKIMPYIIAFNDKFGNISISIENERIRFKANSCANSVNQIDNINRHIDILEIKEIRGGEEKTHYFSIVRDEEVEVAIKIQKQGDNFIINELNEIPKIFVAFPLFGTEEMPFPAVVNSIKFEPTEKRDGIFLGRENTPEIKNNKSLFERASQLWKELIRELIERGINKNIHKLLNFNLLPDKDWLDKNWFKQLIKSLIENIRDISIVETTSTLKVYNEVYFPIISSLEEINSDKLLELWDLCINFLEYKDSIPQRDIVFDWANIIKTWKSLDIDLSEREITIEKLAEKIENCQNIENFKSLISNDIDEIFVLNNFYNLIKKLDKIRLFDERNILLNQNGRFKRKAELYKDENIDQTLKEISKQLGKDIYEDLLDRIILNDIQNLFSPKREIELLYNVINEIKEPNFQNPQYLSANINLFKWLIEKGKLDFLKNYPILSCADEVIFLGGEKVLAPKEIWKEKAQEYSDIFPQNKIISSRYYEVIQNLKDWDVLKEFILLNPVYIENEKLEEEEIFALLVDVQQLSEDQEHRSSENVELSKIAFLELKDRGIIDTVRKSKEKVKKFLKFLFNYVLEEDNNWKEEKDIHCECGASHKVYPSLWLATLKNRAWIPLQRDKSEKPSAESLSLIIKDDNELLEKCKEDNSLLFLNRIGVSITNLMVNIVTTDKEVKIKLDKAIGSLVNIFRENLNYLDQIPQFINEIKGKFNIINQIERNQKIGRLVENILKDIFENMNIKIIKTSIGSDFVIEHDFIEDNQEKLFEIEKEGNIFYIEVKTTSQNFVKMTLPQARKAREEKGKYYLCVIPLSKDQITKDEVKRNAKFIDIGEKIENKVRQIEKFQNSQQEIFREREDMEIEIEIGFGPIYLKINQPIWENSINFEQFILLISNRRPAERQ